MPFKLPPPPTTTETICFVAALFGLVGAALIFRGDPMLALLVGAISAPLAARLLVRNGHKRQRPDGRPHPDDVWFESHPWWEPEPQSESPAADADLEELLRCAQACRGGCGGQAHAMVRPSSRTSVPDAQAVLGIPAEATADQARAAYLRAAKATHPDHGGEREAFLRVQAAWETLEGIYGLSPPAGDG